MNPMTLNLKDAESEMKNLPSPLHWNLEKEDGTRTIGHTIQLGDALDILRRFAQSVTESVENLTEYPEGTYDGDYDDQIDDAHGDGYNRCRKEALAALKPYSPDDEKEGE